MLYRRLIQIAFAVSIVIGAAACGDMPSAPKDGDDKVPCTEPMPHEGMVCIELFGDVWGWF